MNLLNDSDLRTTSGAWWLYFALLAALATFSFVSVRSPLEFAIGLVNAFGLVGLWGYIRQVAVGAQFLWAGYFAVSVVLSAVALALNFVDAVPTGLLVFALVFTLPLYYALWQYAFRSPGAWRPADVQPRVQGAR